MSSNPNTKPELVGVFRHQLAENPTLVMVERVLAKAFFI